MTRDPLELAQVIAARPGDGSRPAPARPDPPHVVIVGGGLAGLAAAVGLVGHDLRLTLLESRPRLGGRAGSFPDPATGELVDNCQHVSMKCCTNLEDFCRRVGTRDLFRPLERLVFLDPEGRRSVWKADRLPAPFHLTRSFLGSRFLGLAEKLRVARGLRRLARAEADDPRPFADWLAAHGQSPRAIERFWATVLVSALNERLDRMDVGHARQVFVEGFLRDRHGHVVEVPTVPLGDLYGLRLERWLAEHGVALRLTTGVRQVLADDEGGLAGVALRSGERIAADFVVLATPFDRVAALIPGPIAARLPWLEGLARLESAPITGIHLWFDREVVADDHAVIVGRTIQWMFNHTALQGRRAVGDRGQYLQLVVSAAYDLAGQTNAEVLEVALRDLAALWPATAGARLLRWRVVTEHGATFAVRPGVDRLRPAQRTDVDGLFLAGDWTDTGWPATMEGAVRSGYRAAEGILGDLGHPVRLVRPDRRAGWLARRLLGHEATARRAAEPLAAQSLTSG
jgi:squalene-associated FAD-dependent desaturase